MQKHGFEVQLLSADGEEIPLIKEDSGIDVKTFPYTREISPITDLKALWLTYKYFRKEKPEIVHTHTPKAGIVGMLAAKLAGVPIRMHTVAGLPLMEATGIKRKVLNFVERLTSWSATNVYPNSFVQRDFMEEQKLATKSKLKVIGKGSSNGIDTEFFSKRHLERNELQTNSQPALSEAEREISVGKRVSNTSSPTDSSTSVGMTDKEVRHLERSATKSKDLLEDRKDSSTLSADRQDTLRSAQNDGSSQPATRNLEPITFCFVGRIVKDKGINELLSAFDKLSKKYDNAKLFLVGGEERELDPISDESIKIVENNKQVISVGFQKDVRPFFAMSDVFVFPSYREGFPNVVMQAGAMELPSIVTNINGSNEIIEDGINGLIIPVKDEAALYNKMELLLTDKELRTKLANPARQMIVDRFEQKFVWNELLKEYMRLLKNSSL